ncbi:MAG: HEAT repeat domain-containing protein [Patescibacteria group bacterium]|jgi:hypothetical protein
MNIKKILPLVICIGLVGLAGLYIAGSIVIGNSVRRECDKAQTKYQEDCISSLSLTLEDADNDFRTRNSAIWALGQLGDKRALPILEKYYTGNIPEKESFDNGLSQYELKKAIKLAQGSFNITHWIWRGSIEGE